MQNCFTKTHAVRLESKTLQLKVRKYNDLLQLGLYIVLVQEAQEMASFQATPPYHIDGADYISLSLENNSVSMFRVPCSILHGMLLPLGT